MPGVSVYKESASNSEDRRDTGLIPGSGRSTGGRHSNPLQYSCLENPMDRGVWQATIHRGHKESDMTQVTEHTTIKIPMTFFRARTKTTRIILKFVWKTKHLK